MTFFLNQATNQFTRAVGVPSEVRSMRAKVRDSLALDVKFHDGLALEALAEGALLVFVLKTDVTATGVTLALVDVWDEVEPGHYRAGLNLNTVPLIGLVGDLKSISVVGELTWSQDGGATWESSNTLAVVVENDVYKGVEGTPAALPDPELWASKAYVDSLPAALALFVPPVAQTAAQWNVNLMGYPEDGDTFVIDDQNGTVENYYFGSDGLGGSGPYIDISGDLYDIVSALIVLLENSTLVSGSQTGHADGHFTLNSLLQGDIGNDIIFTYVPNPVISPQNEGFDIGFDLYGQDPTTADRIGQLAQLPGEPDRWWIAETLTSWREVFDANQVPISVATNTAKKALTGVPAGTRYVITGEAGRLEQYLGDLNGSAEASDANWIVIGPNTVDLWLENWEYTTAIFSHPDGNVSISYGAGMIRVGWIQEHKVYSVTGMPQTAYAYQINGFDADIYNWPVLMVRPSQMTKFYLPPIFPPRAQVKLLLD